MFSNTRVGDKVWSFIYGWGIVTAFNDKRELPLRVKFQTYEDNYETNFTIDGRHNPQTAQVLFWQEFEIPEKAFQKPLPNLKIDTKVLVWDNDDIKDDGTINKKRRYFKSFTDYGKIVTFASGTTSWSTENIYADTLWDNWELAEK